MEYFKDIYLKPYCRISPYVMGMVLGYVLYKHFSKKIKLPLVRRMKFDNRLTSCQSNFTLFKYLKTILNAFLPVRRTKHQCVYNYDCNFLRVSCASTLQFLQKNTLSKEHYPNCSFITNEFCGKNQPFL